MAKSGILHIGLPKTATTSCQEALFSNRESLLKRHGLFYPSLTVSHNSILVVMFMEDPRSHVTVKSRGITTLDGAERLRRRYREKMEADIAGTPWDTLVLSSEGLSNLPVESLTKLQDWLHRFTTDWTVMLWSRHPVSYTTSNVQQLIKGGDTLERLLSAAPLPNIKRRASNAFEVFGQENLRLSAFEEARDEAGGAVAAFCRRLGLPEDTAMEIATSTTTRNESMSMLATLLLSSLNRQRPRFVDGRMNPERRHKEVRIFQQIKGERFRLPPEAEADIRRRSRADVRWMNETFGTRHYLDVLADAEGAPEGAGSPYSPEMLDSMSLLLSDLINKQETRLDQVRHKLEAWWKKEAI
ncbi:MAG TPA: hypothetical protein VM899_01110 [Rubellimicrobium sp.]|nr:hypothetical protein [Rubellimicrobium sp.]